jgi:hypothetical protein
MIQESAGTADVSPVHDASELCTQVRCVLNEI